ncbi:hypothetical protein UT300007_22500 [Clostridium sp. CTA-7]
MMFRDSKWVIYNFLPYEYKSLEKYLESMALKGWRLESITGMLLKFKKSEFKVVKYSVDIMDSISFFDGKDSDKALGYREYCKEAGWEFVCEREKIQIYCSESEESRIDIHTDEGEKFNTIRKASLKYVCLNLITLISLLYIQYIITIGDSDAHFLASTLVLGSLLIVMLFTIHEFIGLIRFIIFDIKGRNSLKRNKKVSYDFEVGVLVKRIIYKVELAIIIAMIIGFTITSDLWVIKLIIVMLLLGILSNYIINFIKNKNYKNNKWIIIGAYTIITLVFFITISNIIFSSVLARTYRSNEKLNEDNYILSLRDFNDKDKDEEVFLGEEKSLLASYLYYSNSGEEIHLSYSLFESKYQWAVRYNFNKRINFANKINVKYIEKETNLPKDIKVYMNEHGHQYFIVSPNRMVEISTIEEISEEELIDIVYKKLFKL